MPTAGTSQIRIVRGALFHRHSYPILTGSMRQTVTVPVSRLNRDAFAAGPGINSYRKIKSPAQARMTAATIIALAYLVPYRQYAAVRAMLLGQKLGRELDTVRGLILSPPYRTVSSVSQLDPYPYRIRTVSTV